MTGIQENKLWGKKASPHHLISPDSTTALENLNVLFLVSFELY